MPSSIEPTRGPAETDVDENSTNQGTTPLRVHLATTGHLRLAYSANDGAENDTPAWLGGPKPSRTSKTLLDRTAQARIGQMLRHIFSDVAEEPVPDRFVMLLEALQAQEDRS